MIVETVIASVGIIELSVCKFCIIESVSVQAKFTGHKLTVYFCIKLIVTIYGKIYDFSVLRVCVNPGVEVLTIWNVGYTALYRIGIRREVESLDVVFSYLECL